MNLLRQVLSELLGEAVDLGPSLGRLLLGRGEDSFDLLLVGFPGERDFELLHFARQVGVEVFLLFLDLLLDLLLSLDHLVLVIDCLA